MNNLSWMLYAFDLLKNLDAFLVFTGWVICGVTLIYVAINGIENNKFTPCPKLWVFAGILFFISVLIPTRNTLYAIAASEIGEKISNNEKIQELSSDAYKALQSWIKSQITDPAKNK